MFLRLKLKKKEGFLSLPFVKLKPARNGDSVMSRDKIKALYDVNFKKKMNNNVWFKKFVPLKQVVALFDVNNRDKKGIHNNS